jgi:hypothetical protein
MSSLFHYGLIDFGAPDLSRSFKNQKTEARPTASSPAPIMAHFGEVPLTGAQSEKQSIGRICTMASPCRSQNPPSNDAKAPKTSATFFMRYTFSVSK